MPTYFKPQSGRRQQIGKYAFDEQTGRLAVCGGYCPACASKILLSRDEVRELAQGWVKDDKNWYQRIRRQLADRT